MREHSMHVILWTFSKRWKLWYKFAQNVPGIHDLCISWFHDGNKNHKMQRPPVAHMFCPQKSIACVWRIRIILIFFLKSNWLFCLGSSLHVTKLFSSVQFSSLWKKRESDTSVKKIPCNFLLSLRHKEDAFLMLEEKCRSSKFGFR